MWVYRQSGIETLPAGTVGYASQLKVTYDRRGGAAPTRTFSVINAGAGTQTDFVDTVSPVDPNNTMQGITYATGIHIGTVTWGLIPCDQSDAQEPGETGGSTVIMPTEEGELIGDELIGDPLAG